MSESDGFDTRPCKNCRGLMSAHAMGCSGAEPQVDPVTPPSRQDTRRTSPEKLERIRIIANDMLRVAAREPNNEAFQQMTISANKIHNALDGEF